MDEYLYTSLRRVLSDSGVVKIKKTAVLASIIFCIIILVCEFAFAIEDSEQQTSLVSLTILPFARLGIVDANVQETLIQDVNSEIKFDQGAVELAAQKPTLIIDANKRWKLTAHTSGFNGPYPKDANDLMLKDASAEHVENGFVDFKSLSIKDQEVASFSAGVKNENHPCQYKILLDYAKDLPGTYTATVTFTLSTQGA